MVWPSASRLATLTLGLFLLQIAVAEAGRIDPKKLKKWPEEDRLWARLFDVWMTDDETKLFTSLTTTEDRKKFLVDTKYWDKWTDVEKEVQPLVRVGDVVEGMTQDEVYMCWDKPVKLRKDFRKSAYVEVLYYDFERDRKGREFLLIEGSETAYNNEVFTRLVYIYNGKVFRVVLEGEEEGVLDQLPEPKAPMAAPAPAEETTPAEAPTPAPEATP